MWTMSLAPLDRGDCTHLEWRFALAGGRLQAARWRLIKGPATNIMRSNFDALVEYVSRCA
jgi:hypothetical protein